MLYFSFLYFEAFLIIILLTLVEHEIIIANSGPSALLAIIISRSPSNVFVRA